MSTHLSRAPLGSKAPEPGEVIDTLLMQAADAPLDTVTALSAACSAEIRRLDAELLHLFPGSPEGRAMVERIHEYERGERELRVMVRRHPDYRIEGL